MAKTSCENKKMKYRMIIINPFYAKENCTKRIGNTACKQPEQTR